MDPEELSTIFINKIPQNTSIWYLIFKSDWQPNYISLQILNIQQEKEWSGIISVEELQQSAEELEIPFEKFFNECKEALTRNGGVECFQYLFEDNKFILTKNDEFPIKYLEVDMRPNCAQQYSLTLSAVNLIASLRGELSETKLESNIVTEKYQILQATLEKCLEEKNNIERNILRKFSVLLNSKKDKIAELQNLLVEKNNMLEEAGISGTESSKRKSTAMLSVDNEDDFMQATQVMTQPVVILPKRMKFNTADHPAPRSNVLSRETASSSTLAAESIDEANLEMDDSPDLFDQL